VVTTLLVNRQTPICRHYGRMDDIFWGYC